MIWFFFLFWNEWNQDSRFIFSFSLHRSRFNFFKRAYFQINRTDFLPLNTFADRQRFFILHSIQQHKYKILWTRAFTLARCCHHKRTILLLSSFFFAALHTLLYSCCNCRYILLHLLRFAIPHLDLNGRLREARARCQAQTIYAHNCTSFHYKWIVNCFRFCWFFMRFLHFIVHCICSIY